jgi:hypothetical protein
MKRLPTHVGACSLTSSRCLAHAGWITAQITSALSPKKLGDAAPIALSSFLAEATTEDAGYTAEDTLAGTRARTELKDADAAISVAPHKLLPDTNSKSSADLLVYTTGTEVAVRTSTRSSPYVSAVGSRSYADKIVTFSNPCSSTRVIIFAASPPSYPAGGGDVGASILTSFNNPNPDTTL